MIRISVRSTGALSMILTTNLIPLITTEITSPATTSKSESLSINVNEIPVMKFPLPQSMKGDILINGMIKV